MTRAGTTAGEHQQSSADGGGGHLRRARGAPAAALARACYARVVRATVRPRRVTRRGRRRRVGYYVGYNGYIW